MDFMDSMPAMDTHNVHGLHGLDGHPWKFIDIHGHPCMSTDVHELPRCGQTAENGNARGFRKRYMKVGSETSDSRCKQVQCKHWTLIEWIVGFRLGSAVYHGSSYPFQLDNGVVVAFKWIDGHQHYSNFWVL